jgi:hypothetical protein
MRPASWSSVQSFWLLIMRSRVHFLVLLCGFFLEWEDSHGDHGLGSLVELRRFKIGGLRPLLVFHIHISSSTSSGQRNCASWASHPQKSVTLKPQPGEETTKSIRDMWWHWKKILPYDDSQSLFHVIYFLFSFLPEVNWVSCRTLLCYYICLTEQDL